MPTRRTSFKIQSSRVRGTAFWHKYIQRVHLADGVKVVEAGQGLCTDVGNDLLGQGTLCCLHQV